MEHRQNLWILKKLYFVSLGCPKNRVDSEVMLGIAGNSGYEVTNTPDKADLLVVNTCSFIQSAREESVETILELAEFKNQDTNKKLIVTGCLAQRYPEELQKELPEVDHFIGTGAIPSFEKIVQVKTPAEKSIVSAPGWLYSHLSPRQLSTPFYTAYVKNSRRM